MHAAPSHGGRPRSPEAGERIVAATLSLLREGGPHAVSVEAVSSRAGVAKTTVYRRYADRAQLLREAFASVVRAPGEPPVGTARERIRWCLDQAWTQMATALGPGGLAACLTDSDPEFTGLFRDALAPYEEAIRRFMADDAATGVLRGDLDVDGVLSLVLGAYLGELLRRGHVEDSWIERCTELLCWSMAAPG
jgi:AcrR family transcriptional regulator